MRLLMSYVPFNSLKRDQQSQMKLAQKGESSPLLASTPQTRHDEQKLITDFIEKVFGDRMFITFEDYHQINTGVSSEMFISIMQVLHNVLPCTKNFY